MTWETAIQMRPTVNGLAVLVFVILNIPASDCLLPSTGGSVRSVEQQREALLSLRTTLGNPPELANWSGPGPCINGRPIWAGVIACTADNHAERVDVSAFTVQFIPSAGSGDGNSSMQPVAENNMSQALPVSVEPTPRQESIQNMNMSTPSVAPTVLNKAPSTDEQINGSSATAILVQNNGDSVGDPLNGQVTEFNSRNKNSTIKENEDNSDSELAMATSGNGALKKNGMVSEGDRENGSPVSKQAAKRQVIKEDVKGSDHSGGGSKSDVLVDQTEVMDEKPVGIEEEPKGKTFESIKSKDRKGREKNKKNLGNFSKGQSPEVNHTVLHHIGNTDFNSNISNAQIQDHSHSPGQSKERIIPKNSAESGIRRQADALVRSGRKKGNAGRRNPESDVRTRMDNNNPLIPGEQASNSLHAPVLSFEMDLLEEGPHATIQSPASQSAHERPPVSRFDSPDDALELAMSPESAFPAISPVPAPGFDSDIDDLNDVLGVGINGMAESPTVDQLSSPSPSFETYYELEADVDLFEGYRAESPISPPDSVFDINELDEIQIITLLAVAESTFGIPAPAPSVEFAMEEEELEEVEDIDPVQPPEPAYYLDNDISGVITPPLVISESEEDLEEDSLFGMSIPPEVPYIEGSMVEIGKAEPNTQPPVPGPDGELDIEDLDAFAEEENDLNSSRVNSLLGVDTSFGRTGKPMCAGNIIRGGPNSGSPCNLCDCLENPGLQSCQSEAKITCLKNTLEVEECFTVWDALVSDEAANVQAANVQAAVQLLQDRCPVSSTLAGDVCSCRDAPESPACVRGIVNLCEDTPQACITGVQGVLGDTYKLTKFNDRLVATGQCSLEEDTMIVSFVFKGMTSNTFKKAEQDKLLETITELTGIRKRDVRIVALEDLSVSNTNDRGRLRQLLQSETRRLYVSVAINDDDVGSVGRALSEAQENGDLAFRLRDAGFDVEETSILAPDVALENLEVQAATSPNEDEEGATEPQDTGSTSSFNIKWWHIVLAVAAFGLFVSISSSVIYLQAKSRCSRARETNAKSPASRASPVFLHKSIRETASPAPSNTSTVIAISETSRCSTPEVASTSITQGRSPPTEVAVHHVNPLHNQDSEEDESPLPPSFPPHFRTSTSHRLCSRLMSTMSTDRGTWDSEAFDAAHKRVLEEAERLKNNWPQEYGNVLYTGRDPEAHHLPEEVARDELRLEFPRNLHGSL